MTATEEPTTGTETAVPVAPIEDVVAAELSRVTSSGSDRVMGRLASHCVALKVTVRGVMHECKIADSATVSVDGQELDKDTIARVTGLAMPAKVRTRITRAADAVRATPARFGTRFPGGAYLIPLRAGDRRPAETAMETLAGLRASYLQTAVECRADWEAHMEELKQKNPSVHKRAVRAVPDGAAFVNAHQVETMLFPIGRGLPTGFWSQARNYLGEHLDDGPLEVCMRQLRHLASAPDRLAGEAEASAWARETREATDRLVQEAVSGMITEPLNEFVASMRHVEQSIRDSRNIQRSTLDRLRESWEKLTSFEFMLPAETMQRLTETGRRLAHMTPQSVNAESRGGGTELADYFRSVREGVTSTGSVSGMVTETFRHLDLD